MRGPEVQSSENYLTFVLGGDKLEERQKPQMYDEHLQTISAELYRQAVLQRCLFSRLLWLLLFET